MDSTSAERVEVNRESRNQGLAFAGLHFRDRALVQDHAANQLHVKVAHVENTPSCLAHYRERLHQNFVENLLQRVVLLFFQALYAVNIVFLVRASRIRLCTPAAVCTSKTAQSLLDPMPELIRFRPQFGVSQFLDLGLQRVDGVHVRRQRLDDTLVLGAENLA